MATRLRDAMFALLVAFSIAAGMDGCSSTAADGDGESHFLTPCTDRCSGGLACLCGVCTKSCTDDAACADLATGATCLISGTCAESHGRVCGVSCTTSADCAGREASRCESWHCKVPGADGADASVDASSHSDFDSSVHANVDSGPPRACTASLDDYCQTANPACIRTLPSDPKTMCSLVGVAENLGIDRWPEFTIAVSQGQDYSTQYVYDANGQLIAVTGTISSPTTQTCVGGPATPLQLPALWTADKAEQVKCHSRLPTPFESACAAIPPPNQGELGCTVMGCFRIASPLCRTAFLCPGGTVTGPPGTADAIPFDCGSAEAGTIDVAGTSGVPVCCTGVPVLSFDGGTQSVGDAGRGGGRDGSAEASVGVRDGAAP
jgi:YD repeat-containing protein